MYSCPTNTNTLQWKCFFPNQPWSWMTHTDRLACSRWIAECKAKRQSDWLKRWQTFKRENCTATRQCLCDANERYSNGALVNSWLKWKCNCCCVLNCFYSLENKIVFFFLFAFIVLNNKKYGLFWTYPFFSNGFFLSHFITFPFLTNYKIDFYRSFPATNDDRYKKYVFFFFFVLKTIFIFCVCLIQFICFHHQKFTKVFFFRPLLQIYGNNFIKINITEIEFRFFSSV